MVMPSKRAGNIREREHPAQETHKPPDLDPYPVKLDVLLNACMGARTANSVGGVVVSVVVVVVYF